MRILDQYISQKFLGTLFFSLLAFSVIYIVIDLVGFMDKFIDEHVRLMVIIKYYLFYLPFIIMLTLPIATLLASLFSIGQLSRYNELIAMQSSGMSIYRILAPLFVLGIIISLLAAYVGERLVPYTNQKKKEIYQSYVDKIKRKSELQTRDIYLQIDKDRWLLIGFYDTNLATAFQVSLQYFARGSLNQRIDAQRMIWEGDKWVARNGFIRQFLDHHETAEAFEELKLHDLLFKPEDMAKVQIKAEEMSYWELKRFIQEVKRAGANPDRWLVDLYLKISFPFANFVIILFGAPLASRKTRSGTALSFGISLFICFFYFGIIKVGQTLGHNGTLPPLISAWLGNLFFGAGAVYILVTSNK